MRHAKRKLKNSSTRKLPSRSISILQRTSYEDIVSNTETFDKILNEATRAMAQFATKVHYAALIHKGIMIKGAPLVEERQLTFIDATFDHIGEVPKSWRSLDPQMRAKLE